MTGRVEQAIRHAPVPLIVSHPKGELPTLAVSLVECADTGTRLYTNYAKLPYSIITGGNVKVTNRTERVTPNELKSLSVIGHCPTCSSTIRCESHLAKNIDKQNIFCNLCGTPLQVKLVQAQDEENGDDGGDYGPNDDDTYGGDSDMSGDEENGDEENGDEENGGDNDGDMGDYNENAAAEDPDDIAGEGDEENPDEGDVTSIDDGETNPEDGAGGQNEENNPDMPATPPPEETETTEEEAPDLTNDDESNQEEAARIKFTYDALAGFKSKLNPDTSHLVLVSRDPAIYYLIADRQPIARFLQEKASDSVKPLFAKPQPFAQAFFAIADNNGLNNETIKDFGIEPVTVEVPVDEVTEQRIRKGIETKEAELREQQGNLQQDLQQALETTAIGMNKEVFKDVSHPVKAALYDELNKIGVRQPTLIIDRAFSQAGEEFMRILISKAFELMKKPLEARNEIARMVLQANYQSTNEINDEDLNIRLQENSVSITATPSTQEDEEEHTPKYKNLFTGLVTTRRRLS